MHARKGRRRGPLDSLGRIVFKTTLWLDDGAVATAASMKLAYHTIAFHDHPLAYAIKNISELGYDGIELNAETNWAKPHLTPETPLSERREMARLISKAGLDVSSICAHMGLVDSNERSRRRAMAYMKGCIGLAREFDTDVVHAIAGELSAGANRRQMMRILAGELTELLDEAEKNDVRLSIEAAVNQLVCNSDTLEELMRTIKDDRLFVNFDPSHYVLYGEDPAQTVRRFGPKIIHAHAKDSRGKPEKFEFPPLGKGIINFPKVIEALREVGYDGFVSVEYEGNIFGYESDPIVAGRLAKEFLDPLVKGGARGR